MKINYTFILIIIFFISAKGIAQTPKNILEDPANTIKMDFSRIATKKNPKAFKLEKGSQPTKNSIVKSSTSASSEYAGTTQDEFEVSLSGAASYNVPIVIPSGIKDIAPSLALSFNSQASNGMAGWGWNISGLSTITRVPSTDYHDGIIDGVDFDNLDRFALDGQRLLLSTGSYGSANSEYQTENYSNLKIKAYGSSPYGSSYGPSYFIVFYPDGSRAYYGNGGSSRGRLEWALYRMQDPQGNYVEYNYNQSNNLVRIDKVKYGSKIGTAPPNEIIFTYKNRARPDINYVNGYEFKRTNLIERVEVRSSGQVFRKYDLTHQITALGYERLTSVREYNSNDKYFPSINFVYDNSGTGLERDGNTITISPGIDIRFDGTISGDFTGDGKMDFATYNRNSSTHLNIFTNLFDVNNGNAYSYAVTTSFDDVFVNNTLAHTGAILPQQALTVIKKIGNQERFRTFAVDPSGGPVFQYDKNWSIPTYNQYSCQNGYPNVVTTAKPHDYVSGDFNGDGLTDVLAVSKRYYQTTCSISGPGQPCSCTTNLVTSSDVTFIDLKRDVTSNFSTSVGSLLQEHDNNSRLVVADFNGDGKSDLIQITNARVRVYTLNSSNQLVQIENHFSGNINLEKPILFGDYNGDGKIDFATPIYEEDTDWRFYLSKGNDIYSYSKDIGVYYDKNYVHDGYVVIDGNGMDNPLYEFHYVAQDYNGDGKTDILTHTVVSPISSTSNVYDNLRLYENKQLFNEDEPSFDLTTNSVVHNNGLTKYGIPIFLETNATNTNLEYAYVDGDEVYTFEFLRDFKKDIELEQISNNGVVTDIYYDRLTSSSGNGTYGFDYSQLYPYINVNIAPSIKVVKESKHTASGQSQRQQYIYEGAVSHAKGLGFLGFKVSKRTNWFGTDVSVLWNISRHDMQKRASVIEQWVSLSSSSTSSSFLNRTSNTYSTTLLPNKVFVNVPTLITKEDGLQNFTTTVDYTYDSYKNPTNVTSTFDGGSKSVDYVYSNNSSAINSTYHVGRPTKKTELSVLSGNSFTTEVEFSYSNNLVTQTRSRGLGTPWLNENFEYDSFGNTTKKIISGSGISNRIEEYEFDGSGRYMTKSTDILGLETTFIYNLFGSPVFSTSPYGLTTSFEYDGWERLLKETNYLGKETNYEYKKESTPECGFCFTKLINYPEGQDEKSSFNDFGWLVHAKKFSLNGQWINKEYEYDSMGRKLRESEPYFSGENPSQWNEIDYDQYGRQIQQDLYTGKLITTSYSGMSVTVNDGTKSVTTTKDAVGNIVSMQDPGGSVDYQYHGNGTMKVARYGSHQVSTTIDAWGRKSSLTDPAAGTYTYEYNILGEITKETTPKGQTDYVYDSFGRVESKEVTGDQTAITTDYTYDGVTKLINSMSALDEGTGVVNQNYLYNYSYDTYKRLSSVEETTDAGNFKKEFTFDAFGRIDSERFITNDLTSGVSSDVKIKNSYDASGILEERLDFNTNSSLWKINEENARGQLVEVDLGNGMTKTKTYDQYGFVTEIKDKENVTGGNQAMRMTYTFNAQRGILNNRKNYEFTNWDESFIHDNLNRLTTITGPNSHTQSYDTQGRINNNSFVGDYNYSGSKMYQLDDVDLNTQGDIYYQNHFTQRVTYNAFKKPVEIEETGKGRVSFEYGPLMNRTFAYYGGEQIDKSLRQYEKQYSSIMPIEIVNDFTAGTTKILTYVGGDGYTAPIVQIKMDGPGLNIDEYHYLHRDYLGSILAISDSDADVVEQRQFGAWGKVDNYVDESGNNSFSHDSLIGRGFTGHEHFFEVSLLHMNGRMYDANLGRFLSPDNYIQDPYNTQSYNRYGYVFNNPLSFSDPSGEIAFLAAVAIGALIGGAVAAVTYTIPALITGNWNASDFGTSILYGAIGGAISGGLSSAGSALFTSAVANGGTGAFWQSATFNVLSEVASQVGTSLALGDAITLGTIGGAVAGGFVGGKIPAWSGVKGGYFKNALSEIGYGAFKGGARGAVAGAVGAVIDGNNLKDGIVRGAKNGAIGGASQHFAMIATFGATFKPSDEQLSGTRAMESHFGLSADKVAWRKGGLYQVVQPALAKLFTPKEVRSRYSSFNRPVTWGNSVATFGDTDSATFGHEFGHIFQVQKQGWAAFQGIGAFEQLFIGNSAYSTPGTNEYNAEYFYKLAN